MRTDGLFSFRVVEVPLKAYNKPISLYPISDVHYNSPSFAHERWQSFLEEVRADPNDKYFILLGDTLDTVSSSERRMVLSGDYHKTTILKWESDIENDVKRFLKEVSPLMKNRTLGVFCGNHFFEFSTGQTTETMIAKALNAPYVGCAGYIVLILKRDKYHAHEVKIFAHHGTSEKKMRDARANFRCDLLLMGHNHQLSAMPVPEIDCSGGGGGYYKIVEHETKLVRTGSFLKSYENNVSSYAADLLLSPSKIGCPKILITIKRQQLNPKTREDARWVEIKAVV